MFVQNVSLNGGSDTTIYINDNEYNNSFAKTSFKVTDSTLATTNLISVLKGYKEKIIKEHVEPQKQRYLIEAYTKYVTKQKCLKELI